MYLYNETSTFFDHYLANRPPDDQVFYDNYVKNIIKTGDTDASSGLTLFHQASNEIK